MGFVPNRPPRVTESEVNWHMANRDIIARMGTVLDEYQAARAHPDDVGRSIPFHIQALDALPYRCIEDADHLCYRLATAHPFVGGVEFIDREEVAKVLTDFRAFLASLPAGAG